MCLVRRVMNDSVMSRQPANQPTNFNAVFVLTHTV